MKRPLFPPYLDAIAQDGTRSQGPAVATLQLILIALPTMVPTSDYWGHPEITGVYDDATIDSVKELQRRLNNGGFMRNTKKFAAENLDEDGNFGPATRAAVKKHFGIDFDAMFLGDTIWIDPKGKIRRWIPGRSQAKS